MRPASSTYYIARARVRFQKAGEQAILERWIEFYQSGERLVAAKAAMERSKRANTFNWIANMK